MAKCWKVSAELAMTLHVLHSLFVSFFVVCFCIGLIKLLIRFAYFYQLLNWESFRGKRELNYIMHIYYYLPQFPDCSMVVLVLTIRLAHPEFYCSEFDSLMPLTV